MVRLISEDLKTPEIARQLNLSPNTVHTYRRRIMDKLDRHSVAAPDQIRGQHGAHHAVAALSRQFLPPAVKTAPVFRRTAPSPGSGFRKKLGIFAKCTR